MDLINVSTARLQTVHFMIVGKHERREEAAAGMFKHDGGVRALEFVGDTVLVEITGILAEFRYTRLEAFARPVYEYREPAEIGEKLCAEEAGAFRCRTDRYRARRIRVLAPAYSFPFLCEIGEKRRNLSSGPIKLFVLIRNISLTIGGKLCM